jgi:four helix bundle protein
MNEEGRTELETGNRNANTERTSRPARKGDDIAERLLALGAAVVKLLDALSQRPGAKSLVKQLERCGPAGGANYEEARGAESPADFIHKVRIALKEVRETRYWLRLVLQAELLEDAPGLRELIEETGELIAILTASANTARRRTEQRT